MRTYRFINTDVFTKTRFGGNQLAVFVEGDYLTTDEMQSIAQEMNFSETTFILPPDTPEADWKVRIFTPARELPFAGHPTIGTAYVLAKEGMVELKSPKTEIHLEMGVGVIPVTLEVTDSQTRQIGFVQMSQKLPTYGPEYTQIDKIAQALSIDLQEIQETNLPSEVVSCGQPYLIVPIKSLNAIETMKPSLSLVEEIRAEIGQIGFYVFSQETVHQKGTDDISDLSVQSRMFTVGLGLHEDPATGGASGPLGCYLVKHKVVSPKSVVKIISNQGYQIDRPSTIHIDIGMDGAEIVDVRVGGYVVPVSQGIFYVD